MTAHMPCALLVLGVCFWSLEMITDMFDFMQGHFVQRYILETVNRWRGLCL